MRRFARSPSAELSRVLGAGALITACVNPAWSADDGNLQFHGFLGQSVIQTTHNNFFGKTAGQPSADYTELGGNVSYRATPEWLLSTQVMARHAGQSDTGSVKLDYAFASYTPINSESGRVSFLLGKAKLPYGLYNETRDTPAARPSILLPQSIYLDRLRDTFQSAPSAQIHAEHDLYGGTLAGQFDFFEPDLSERNSVLGLLGPSAHGSLEGRPSESARLIYQSTNERLRFALTEAHIRGAYRPGGGDLLRAGNIDFAPQIVSFQWQEERWSLAAEYLTRQMKYRDFGAARPNQDLPGKSWYAQGTWRFNPTWEGLLRYDVYYMDSDDPKGVNFAAVTGKPAWSRYAKDRTAGVRYKFAPGWHLAGEIHNVDGTGWIPLADNPNSTTTTQRRWNMYLLQLSYQF